MKTSGNKEKKLGYGKGVKLGKEKRGRARIG